MNQEKIKKFEKTINNDYSNIVGIIVQKNDIKLYEHYFNGFTADNAIHVFSVTKSVVSVLIGIAIDKGYIKNVDQKILDFFPDYTVKTGEKTIQGVWVIVKRNFFDTVKLFLTCVVKVASKIFSMVFWKVGCS